ncbi:hypothetical protein [Natrinema gelatinilyticum]|uniref:hypothetical protein n=1 Tax=Natrinema gelatinilyticum TaxID=2961571 RepID=UPI0020C47E8F|nr:hypothetical protein [Natrinema gelatinilyticum]
MRELRSCDFCGADAAGTFEIVPPVLEPTEAEQRRVVLCPDCRERLEALIEPLIARAGVDVDVESRTEGRQGESTENGSNEKTGAVVATANESTEKRRRTPSSNATGSEPTGSTGSEVETNSDSGTESSAETVLEDGITFERTECDSVTVDECEPGSGGTTGSRTESSADDGVDSSASTAAVGPSNPTPGAYSKVVRLLRNRHFPMQRSAVEELAAGAYDLEGHEVEAIIDHAVETGEFVEEREMLVRP